MWPFGKKKAESASGEAGREANAPANREAEIARAQLLWKQGSRYLERRRYDKAIESFSEAAQIEPSRLEGRLNLGAAFYLDGQPAEALPHLRYVLALEPQNTVALLNLAAALDAVGEVEKSVETLETLVAARPNWEDAHYNLAVAYMKMDRRDEAKNALQKELKLNPEHAAARTLLNEIHLKPTRGDEPSPYLKEQLAASDEFERRAQELEAQAREKAHSRQQSP